MSDKDELITAEEIIIRIFEYAAEAKSVQAAAQTMLSSAQPNSQEQADASATLGNAQMEFEKAANAWQAVQDIVGADICRQIIHDTFEDPDGDAIEGEYEEYEEVDDEEELEEEEYEDEEEPDDDTDDTDDTVAELDFRDEEDADTTGPDDALDLEDDDLWDYDIGEEEES